MVTNKQVHILYSGTVQGVGFRFTALGIAKENKLTGWVKNLASGEVEIIAEGRQKDIENFLQAIGEYFEDYIRDEKVTWSEAKGRFLGFQIEM